METAIFAVSMLILLALVAIGLILHDIRWQMGLVHTAVERHASILRELSDHNTEIRDVLSEASKRNAQRTVPPESAFEKPNDKIPASLRYTPIARRRAAAEAASAGPASHKAEVTANNARAMETL